MSNAEAVSRWCENLVSLVKDGGIWYIPRSDVAFQINRQEKSLTLVAGNPASTDVSGTRDAFAAIGWGVKS